MESSAWHDRESTTSLRRLLPRVEARFAGQVEPAEWEGFRHRLETHFPRLFRLLLQLYGTRYDFFFHLEQLLISMTEMWLKRPDELRALDGYREADPEWFQSNRMLGAMVYVDLFAGNFAGLRSKLPYLTELGVTYLHLMPIFRTPEGDNDGGYAVSSYRETDPQLGTMEELDDLARELRHHGISLCVDFILNHTADDHEWALKALDDDVEYQEYYRMFPDRREPDEYERSIMAVFPQDHPGCFVYRNAIRKWIWTSFHGYQWDLNYENPVVFTRMAEEMLFLANQGVEVLRLDAVAFLWKRIGTASQNLPEAHYIIQAFNAITKICCPGVVFKSEAIVHPDEVRKYIDENECQLSYNPQLMALLWESLATRDVRLLRFAMQKRFALPGGCAWVNYIRCHDDIGWMFSNEDAYNLNIDAYGHRRFLTDFFVGRFPGTFSRGLPFQEDPRTGDARVSGMAASLCGLEKALAETDEKERDLAIRRILMMHGVIITIGGIPLIYLGDEIAMLNEYGYRDDPEKAGDSRWVHRPPFDWSRAELRHSDDPVVGRVYQGLLRMVQLRRQNLAFTRGDTEIIETANTHVFGYIRSGGGQTVLVLANFSEHSQALAANRLRMMGLRRTFTDIVSGRTITAMEELLLEPYQFMVIAGVR